MLQNVCIEKTRTFTHSKRYKKVMSQTQETKTFSMERRYCFMWLTHYDVTEFLHVLQLRYAVLELRSVVL